MIVYLLCVDVVKNVWFTKGCIYGFDTHNRTIDIGNGSSISFEAKTPSNYLLENRIDDFNSYLRGCEVGNPTFVLFNENEEHEIMCVCGNKIKVNNSDYYKIMSGWAMECKCPKERDTHL